MKLLELIVVQNSKTLDIVYLGVSANTYIYSIMTSNKQNNGYVIVVPLFSWIILTYLSVKYWGFVQELDVLELHNLKGSVAF